MSARRCVICHLPIPKKAHKHRATCSELCSSAYRSSVAGGPKTPNRQDWTRELQPWPAGISFASVDEGAQTYFMGQRPATHVPYGGSASWAVR